MTYKAHFDGHAIILDEPVALTPGQVVEVEVALTKTPSQRTAERMKYFGILKDFPVDGRKYTEDMREEWEGREKMVDDWVASNGASHERKVAGRF